MTASKTRPARRPARAAATPATQPAVARRQVAATTESADAMLRGFAAMRTIHDRAMQAALARYARAAQQLKTQRAPMELLALPAALLRSEVESAASYWQELGGAAMEMQAELLGCSSRLVDSDALLQTASAVDALPLPPAFPDFFAFGRLFGAGQDRPRSR